MGGSTITGKLSVLLDTNIILALEGDEDAHHVNGLKASEVYRMIGEAGGRVQILENQFDDFARIGNSRLRHRRHRQLRKYPTRQRVNVPGDFLNAARYDSSIDVRGNDAVDAALLLALHRNTASWLITEDRGVHSHARHIQLHERVMTLDEARTSLQALLGAPASAHFSADLIEPHTLDLSAPFFDSLREGYEGFNEWWTDKVVAQGRPCLLIGSETRIRGLAVLDMQNHAEAPGPGMKICTFKISEADQGRKLGEALLEASLTYARTRGANSCFIEVAEDKDSLIGLVKEFGFFSLGHKEGACREQVFGKVLNPEVDRMPPPEDPLAFNRRYGPGRRVIARAFVVPIIPKYHEMLFPAAEPQGALFDAAYGNAIRKVYISHAGIRSLEAGDTLLFLRTHKRQAIQAIGIVEQVLRTDDVGTLLGFAGSRTVYSVSELEELCRKEVIAIKFRLDEVLEHPVTRNELIDLGVFTDSPQSISQVRREESIEWVRSLQDA